MIHITSEGNLFTSFCISVVGTASFHQLTVTALIQFSIQSFLFLLVNCNLFAIKKKKQKKNSAAGSLVLSCVPYQLQDRFCVFWCLPCLFQESIFSGLKTYKASSLGFVGKLTERKWTTHMESNMIRRVTLELT